MQAETSMPHWRTTTPVERNVVEAVKINYTPQERFSGQIKREGQRTLKAGVNVRVQLKRQKKTKRSDGYVVECYEDNTVLIDFGDFVKQVPVDEFVKGRAGTTK